MFRQTLVHEGDDGLVTFMPAADVARPTTAGGRRVLEPGSPVVWFTFPGAWHDIGRFHTADGRFTGCYANILTPVELDPAPGETVGRGRSREAGPAREDRWSTTDLFLDVFLHPDGRIDLLDRDELREAVARGWLDPNTARAADAEAQRLVAAARAGTWPPPVVEAWPLERARAAAGTG